MVLCGLSHVAAASAAKGPKVSGELDRLVAAGALAPAERDADLATYKDAKATVKKLNGTRKGELNGVVSDLDDMTARGQLTASRVKPLFVTLARNLQYWKTGPLLGYNQRVSFPDSQLVFQHYAGHGIQIQWLATFGKLNGYFTGGKRYDARAGALLDELLPLATERAAGLAWEYLFPFDGQSPPWVSSLAQGTGLQSMAREAVRLKRPDVLPIAGRGLGIFLTPPPQGVRYETDGGAHYLQYSGKPHLEILNGFIQSLVGLFDFAKLTGDTIAQTLFQQGDAAAQREVPRFDTGAWSLYSRDGASKPESDLGYHTLLRDFLTSLCSRTATPVYCGTAQHFTNYLKVPPKPQVLTSTLRKGKTGRLRFKLDKVSHVTVRITRKGKLADTRALGAVSRGSHWISFRPAHSGAYDISVAATDLAGNPATAAGSVEVKGAK